MNNLNLDKNKKYLLACSFGPDSMALFHFLRVDGYNFECAIVNYHLRKESDLEVKGLMDYAAKFDIKVHVLDVKEVINTNIEGKCREIRYNFFSSLYNEFKYDALLVAHHEDDHIETYLLQKQRQNTPNYYGIEENTVIKEMNVIRPLLGYTKQDLLNICINNNVPYALDVTNEETIYMRNKIRHEIVMNLREKLRHNLLLEIQRKNEELKKELSKIDTTRVKEVSYLLSLNELQQKHILNDLAKEAGFTLGLSKENVGEIINVLKSKKPNSITKIKSNLFLIKEYTIYDLASKAPVSINYSFVLNEPGVLDTDFFYLDFTGDTSNRNVSLDDYPLTIRPIKATDVYQISRYRVQANRLMIDWKMPASVRKIWPVIVNKDNNVIYIPRYQVDFNKTDDLNFYVKIK